MSKLPGIQAHMKAAAALATGFDPVDYDLRAVCLAKASNKFFSLDGGSNWHSQR
jgi:hypothetical protein